MADEKEQRAWYRKYRPVTMDDYMGDGIKKITQARFTDPDKRPHVLMVYGTRGCGKTTFARIIAKYYLCETPNEKGEPCEQCAVCQDINNVLISGESGSQVEGVMEIDATQTNGKDAITEIMDDAIIPPTFTKYKVLILDECHMITTQAQNALLKLLEDIPSHLVIILATTDPEKVLPTISSRCELTLEVKKHSIDSLALRLHYIAQQEGLTTSMEALKVIAKKAGRIPREAINLLEHIAKSNGNKVLIENVRELQTNTTDLYLKYFEAANKSLEDILLFVRNLKKEDDKIKPFIEGLPRFVLDCLYIKHFVDPGDYTDAQVKAVKEIYRKYKSKDFDMLLQIIEDTIFHCSKDEDKNELILTTLAMRIGKIGALSSGGLTEEFILVEKENKRSLAEYHKSIASEIEARNDKAISTSASSLEDTSRVLRELHEVVGITKDEDGKQIDLGSDSDPVVGILMKSILDTDKIETEEVSTNADTFSEEELLRMLEES